MWVKENSSENYFIFHVKVWFHFSFWQKPAHCTTPGVRDCFPVASEKQWLWIEHPCRRLWLVGLLCVVMLWMSSVAAAAAAAAPRRRVWLLKPRHGEHDEDTGGTVGSINQLSLSPPPQSLLLRTSSWFSLNLLYKYTTFYDTSSRPVAPHTPGKCLRPVCPPAATGLRPLESLQQGFLSQCTVPAWQKTTTTTK